MLYLTGRSWGPGEILPDLVGEVGGQQAQEAPGLLCVPLGQLLGRLPVLPITISSPSTSLASLTATSLWFRVRTLTVSILRIMRQ